MLVYCGYPRAHEDDAERAVRAGLRLIDAVGRLDIKSAKLQPRVGIATRLMARDPALSGALLLEYQLLARNLTAEVENRWHIGPSSRFHRLTRLYPM